MLLLFVNGLLFALVAFGVAWPLAARLNLDPAEKVVASVLLSLLATYLAAFAIYLLALPASIFWLLPGVAVAGGFIQRQALVTTLRDPDARALVTSQLLVTGWCTAWLFFISSYSGGGWTSDWYEHWERTLFFLDRWPLDAKFLGLYDLPARPPLANLLTGALGALAPRDFAHYQLFTALLNSVAFLPAALLARRFQPRAGRTAGGGAVMAVLAVLLMVNPSWVENVTFAWTKLIAAFFILTGLYFFLRARDTAPPRAAGPLCATALAAGILAHYSAGPYALLLALAWLVPDRTRPRDAAFWRQTAGLGALGAAVLATWFGWSLAVYGLHTTLLSNSSVTAKDVHTGNQLVKVVLNLRDTLVPHFLRPLDEALIAQSSRWGYWHDWFFQLYQLNLFFVFGSVAWLVIIRELVRGWPATEPGARRFWMLFAGGAAILGVAVHGGRDTWGLVHICLQALVIIGLAYLAARWPALGRGWRRVLVAGATIDFFLGLALHFAVQSYALDRWLTPARDPEAILRSYSATSLMNAVAKMVNHITFFRDVSGPAAVLAPGLLAGMLILAIARAARPPA